MLYKKIFRLLIFSVFAITGINTIVLAQTWNPAHAVGTNTGNYHFSLAQTPSQLVEIFPAAIPNTGLTYQWEWCATPLEVFANVSGATSSSYTFPGALTQTTYYRRKTTHTASSTSIYSNVIKISVVSVNWEDINYVREHDVLRTGTTSWTTIDNMPIGEKLQTTTYLDGIGRSVEKISRETATPASGTLWGDMVQFVKYDAYGRTPVSYLPYTTTTQSGKFKTVPTTEQTSYYSTVYSETSAYSTITFDNSPLNRAKNVKKPGTAWAAGAGNSAEYDLNTTTDNVRIFTIAYTQGAAPASSAAYTQRTLYKFIYTDENSKDVVEFYDKRGLLILKKVQLDNSPAGVYTGWICTYNVYDEFGQLRVQITPEAVKYLEANSWSFSGTNGTEVLNGLCFQYFYDEKGRNTWKKAPGADALVTIYDERDRAVFMQDGNQAALSTPQWIANLYDELDRVVITTLYNTTKSINDLEDDIDNASGFASVTVTNPDQIVDNLVVNNRDIAITTYTARTSIEFVDGFESVTSDEFIAEIDPAATMDGYTVDVATYKSPISQTDLNDEDVTTVLKYFFYDNYSFSSVKAFDNNFTNTTAYSTSDANVYAIAKSNRTISMVTGSMIRILGSTTFLSSTYYYDEKGHSIQALSDNAKSGVDITTTQYYFDGRVLSVCSDHSAPGTAYANFKTLTKYLFDKLGRITSTEKKYASNAFKTIASYDYDDAGRVKSKNLDPGYTNPNTGNPGLESLNYSFNIHNQLTGINKDYALKNPANYDKWEHFFGMYLGYDNSDNVFAQAQLNGQITGQLWNTMGDDAQRRYDYTYDNAGRLINAVFKQQDHPGDGWVNSKMDFSVSGYTGQITYDLNGNLLSMLQKGVVPGSSSPITVDDLRYAYTARSNKLISVTDQMSSTSVNGKFGDLIDGGNGSSPDYVYDNNGNLVIDLNKNAKDLNSVPGANGIKYNFLDKPEEIRIAGKGVIKIVYSADGEKLKRTYTPESGSASTTVYINQFVYQSTAGSADELSYINFEDGRIRLMNTVSQDNGLDALSLDGNIDLPGGKRGVYDYYIMDHLQNVRMILTEETHVAKNTCTMETRRASIEEPIFGQTGGGNEVTATRYAVSSTSWVNSSIGASVSRVGNNAGQNIGPNTLQKVMAGDKITAAVQYYYQSSSGNSGSGFVTNLLSSLGQAISGGSAVELVKNNATSITTQLNATTGFVNAVTPAGSGGSTPQAWLTILFFDERFNFIAAADGGVAQDQVASSVGSSGSTLGLMDVQAPKNGYVFVYVSNRSDEHVYFDNLEVQIDAGNIIEENHYYAYGLKITGLSSKKLGNANEGQLKNNYQYQGAFSEMDDDIGWNDFDLRNYDPQIGRWVQQDPFQQFATPYSGMGNDPISNSDPTGGVVVDPTILSKVTVVGVRKISHVSKAIMPAVSAVKLGLKAASGINIINNGIHTKPTGSQYPLYKSKDAAAFGWAKTFGSLGKTGDAEYSSAIYEIKVKNNGKEETLYGFTRAVRFENDKTASGFSPGPFDDRHKPTLPPGAEIVGQIHMHYAKADDPLNRTFSSGDDAVQSKQPRDFSWYLLNNEGELRVLERVGAKTKRAPIIGINFYGYDEVKYRKEDVSTDKLPYPDFEKMTNVGNYEKLKPVFMIDPTTGKVSPVTQKYTSVYGLPK